MDHVAPGCRAAAQEGLGRPARDARDDRRHELVDPAAGHVDFRAPETVGHRGQHAPQLRLLFLQLGVGVALFADVAGRDERQRLRLDVQAGDGDVDGYPDVVLARAEKEAFLGMEDFAVAGGVAQAFLALAGEAEPVGHRLGEQLVPRQGRSAARRSG